MNKLSPKIWRGATASLVTLAFAGCSTAPPDPRTQDRLVEVATVGSGHALGRSVTGVVTARVQSDLGFRISGKVIQRLVNAGQSVRRGQLLMRIDDNDNALTLAAARARWVQAAAEEMRYRSLAKSGAVAPSAYDQVRMAADTALAQMKLAQDATRYTTLVADADGVVIETLAEPGQVVATGQVVIRLAHAGPREADVSLPETIRPPVGSIAQASIFNFNGSAMDGGPARLRQLSAAADPQTRTYDARYVLEGTAANAPLGSTVTLTLPGNGNASAMEVPLSAIMDRGQGPGVWIVGGKKPTLSWRPIQLTSVASESAKVAGGLNPGERFVALGAQLLYAGESVRIAPATVKLR